MRAFSAVMVRVSHIMPALVSALNAPFEKGIRKALFLNVRAFFSLLQTGTAERLIMTVANYEILQFSSQVLCLATSFCLAVVGHSC